jgi:DegV family protein with EDD domain
MTEVRRRTKKTYKITYLDGMRLHRALVAGIQEVISRQDYLNRINVFPVPDRDTGTNMALTLNSVIEETSDIVSVHTGEMLLSVADAALNGARGNSGAILAQFFQGLSDGANGIDKMGPADFVAAVESAVTLAHQALSEPKEGTILTVIAAFGRALRAQLEAGDVKDFVALLEPSIQAADEALNETANQLKEMRRAKVVDAGAQGFVDLLHGIYDFICNGQVRGFYDNLVAPRVDEVEEHVHEMFDTTYRFCTECLVKGEAIDQQRLREELNVQGNSLIVAGSPVKTKVHIHTNDPALVFHICRQYGQVIGEKADDMVRQQQTINHERSRIAILTDSGADIPPEVLDDLDVHIVPILINFGEQSYIDKISMTPDQFYKELEVNEQHPTTSQPSFGDFNRQYQFINTHYESIIAIHIPKAVSGTLNASASAAKRVYNRPVSIVDSLSSTTGLGLIVTYAAEAAKAGFTHNQILRAVQGVIPKTKMFAALVDLDFTVRGGRVSASKKRMVDALRLTPVISHNADGSIKVAGVLPGRKQLARKMASFVVKRVDSSKTYRIVVMHCNQVEEAEVLKGLLEKALPNIESCRLTTCGAALGVHAGPGAIGVALQEYEPPVKPI